MRSGVLALPWLMDGGQASQGVTPAIGWMEDYWMGRYGFILPPEEKAVELLEVLMARFPRAAAYSGPNAPIAPSALSS